jgi:NAD+ kinase
LKFGIFVHPKRPKVTPDKIISQLESAGIPYSKKDPDVAIVIGGDGTFGYYGRKLGIPLLFVGVQESRVLGSKARLAEIFYDDLIKKIQCIQNGEYSVLEKNMLSVTLKDKSIVDVLTDVYLERAEFSGCLRYATIVKPYGNVTPFADYAIGNGVIISSSFGSGGYFSHPDRLQPAKHNNLGSTSFADYQVGICHILPTYLVRRTKRRLQLSGKIRYTVPIRSIIQLRLLREASARLYGTTIHSRGIPVTIGDTIIIGPSKKKAKIIKLASV